MTATKLIALRVLLAILAVSIYRQSANAALLAVVLFVVVEFIDWIDGLVAQHLGHKSAFGGLLDIYADQCIETLFWFLFLQLDLVPMWIPAFILVRNTIINLMRISALQAGNTVFGTKGMLTTGVGRLLVASRSSRFFMVFVKLVGFVALMLEDTIDTYGRHSVPGWIPASASLNRLATAGLLALVVTHLVRGAIYVWDARSHLRYFLWSQRDAASGAEYPEAAERNLF